MLYPLYEYYKNRDLTLDEIVDHYVTRFYAKKHDGKLLKPYVGKPVTDEFWTLSIHENVSEGVVRYGRV